MQLLRAGQSAQRLPSVSHQRALPFLGRHITSDSFPEESPAYLRLAELPFPQTEHLSLPPPPSPLLSHSTALHAHWASFLVIVYMTLSIFVLFIRGKERREEEEESEP